jgi:hypothetical protein
MMFRNQKGHRTNQKEQKPRALLLLETRQTKGHDMTSSNHSNIIKVDKQNDFWPLKSTSLPVIHVSRSNTQGILHLSNPEFHDQIDMVKVA